jgi:hypothetical protein
MLGSLTSGSSISGAAITGSSLSTAFSGSRVEIAQASGYGVVDFYNTSNVRVGRMQGGTTSLSIVGNGDTVTIGGGYTNIGSTNTTVYGLTVYNSAYVSGTLTVGGTIGGNINMGTNSITNAGNLTANGGITCDNAGSGGGFTDGTYIGGGSTTASINNNGRIVRTSTKDMKTSIKKMTSDEAQTVLGLESYTFEYKKEKGNPKDPRRYPGFIGEQGAEVGAELWVARQHKVERDVHGNVTSITRDEDGKVVGFRTPDVVVAHNVLIKDLFKQVEDLKAEVAALKAGG